MKRKLFTVLSLMLSLLLVLCGCGAGEKETATWELSEITEKVDLHTALQKSYLSDDYNSILDYAQGVEELSRPEELTLSWTATPINAGSVIQGYTVEYATSEDFSDAFRYTTQESELEITNLCIATKYFWRVTAKFTDGSRSVSLVQSFETADVGPRNLYVDGVKNVRDLGGWKTADGGRVRQGMIFRGGRLNESERETPKIEITADGIATMISDLGIRTEIDLRMKEAHNHEAGGVTSSPLGDSVQYFNIPLEWDTGNTLLDNISSVREFFHLAADEENYPFIFHCNIGTDRTGMFAFLINGLLGVSEEDLFRDYLFSNFADIGGRRELSGIENGYLKTVRAAEGETLSEKIRSCLIANGIPSSDLDALVSIMK